MVTDRQVKRLMKLLSRGRTLAAAAAKADMDEKTARKYRKLGRLPTEVKSKHTWRTREDPFGHVWDELKAKLAVNPGLEAKTLFDDLQPGFLLDCRPKSHHQTSYSSRPLTFCVISYRDI
jgi:hypothetical protein